MIEIIVPILISIVLIDIAVTCICVAVGDDTPLTKLRKWLKNKYDYYHGL